MIFLPIRDASGTTQLILTRQHTSSGQVVQEDQNWDILSNLPPESVICIRGTVQARASGSERMVLFDLILLVLGCACGTI